MLRIKRVHKSLVIYVVLVYSLALLLYRRVAPGPLETLLTYENYTWTKLSDEVFVLSAYHETRDVPNSPFVRIITIAK